MTGIRYRSDDVLLWHGDCLDLLRQLPDASIDAVVTDPPYALEFMGKTWDRFDKGDAPGSFQHWCELWATECLRVLKPGGHLLAFGGTRTFHRLAAGIEDAGFEIRDSIAWLYGSGFPKSHNLKDEWAGWGTALKPAFEPIVVARKPLVGTVAANVLAHGTGALNIDRTRIIPSDPQGYAAKGASVVGLGSNRNGAAYGEWSGQRTDPTSQLGRWPANVILDEDQAAALDAQSGIQKDGVAVNRNRRGEKPNTIYGKFAESNAPDQGFGGSGGASRFFYVAKAPTKERPKVWGPSCNCETVKPCADGLLPTATDVSASTADTSSSTSRSGRKRKREKSQTDTTSTTETETSSTTESTTSSSSPSSSTSGSTPGANFGTANGGSPAASATSSSPSPSSTGTSAQKGGRSTADADPATSSAWSATSVCASCGAPAKSEAHSTVKPLTLMQWLIRLVTPPGGVVLDPFAGSGTTVEAALRESVRCMAMEREADYLPLIMHRIERHQAKEP